MRFMGFLRSWMLPVSMTIGAVSYLTLARMDMLVPYRDSILKGVSIVQPTLLFLMLLLTFCRIRPSDLRLRRWHFTMLLFQGFGSAMIAAILSVMPPSPWHTIGQGAVLCIICPTATAAVVVTRRLGGDMASVTTYTILINFLAALLLPALLPWMHDGGGNGFVSDLLRIASHTFPILVMPMVVTMLLRLWVPRLVDTLANLHDLPFYLWAVSLRKGVPMAESPFLYIPLEASSTVIKPSVSHWASHWSRCWPAPYSLPSAIDWDDTNKIPLAPRKHADRRTQCSSSGWAIRSSPLSHHWPAASTASGTMCTIRINFIGKQKPLQAIIDRSRA